MGEILGLGITHYPALTGRVPRPLSLQRLLKDPGLPERYRTPDGWPETNCLVVRWRSGDERADCGASGRRATPANRIARSP